MLVALFAVLGFSNASAQALKGTTQYGDGGLKYKILSIRKATSDYTVSVSQNVYNTNGAAALVIPSTVDINVKGTDEASAAIDEKITFKIVEIEDNAFENVTKATSIQIGKNIKKIGTSAFSGCTAVTSITFDADNTNDMEIEADAFKGTQVTALDLSPLKGILQKVNKWFDNSTFTVGTEDVKNNKLTTITFPARVKEIVVDAFAGFSALTTVNFTEVPAGTAAQELTIGKGIFQETPIVDLDLTNSDIKTLYKPFEDDNVTLKTVKMPKAVVTLETNALANCIQLNSVDFSKSVNLTTLKGGSLSNTVVSEYDFTNCFTVNKNAAGVITSYNTNLNFTTGENPFVNTVTLTNKNLVTVKLPYESTTLKFSPVTEIATVFANCEVLTTIDKLDVSKITTVADGAFANDKSLTALEFPLSLTTVNGSPFTGCIALATLTFNNQNAAPLTIGDNTNNIYGKATASLAALQTLNIVSQKGITDNTKKTANVTIATNALVGCTGITTLNIAVGGIFVGTVNTFALNEEANATITIGDIETGASFAKLTGPKGVYTTELTTGSVNVTFANEIVDGIVSKATVGEIKDGSVLTAIGQAKEIKFAGNITVALAAPTTANAALTTIDFGTSTDEDAVNIPTGNIAATVFDLTKAPNLTEVTWKPADANATKAFVQTAFGDGPKGTSAKVTLHTTTAVGDGFYELKEANLYNVIFDAEAAPIVPEVTEVYGTATADYFYGKLLLTKKVEIAKTNKDGDQVEVYSAFVDTKDQKIYMDRLSLKNGLYVIAANEPVIIRVKAPTTVTDHAKIEGGKVAEVEYLESSKYNTMRYIPTGGGKYKLVNDLKVTDKIFSSDYIGTNYVGKTLYAMANPAKVGTLQFDPVAKTSYLPKSALFVETEEVATARLEIVWPDADEATGIIEKLLENNDGNDVIYNLKGMRMSDAQKGIYIKNGKKFIVK